MRPVQPSTGHSVRLGVLLSFVGGALDAYTFIGRGGVFANAQTGNVVLSGIAFAGGNWVQALRHIPPILAFVLGVVVAEWLKRPRMARIVRRPARAALVLEAGVLVVVGTLPDSADVVATVLVSFTASLQVSAFRKLVDTAYFTTMITGNLRTTAQSACLAVVDRDPEAGRRARRFAAVIGGFLVGAITGGLLTFASGIHAAWAAAGFLVLGLALLVRDERIAAR
ncbi:YoaK family protein [Streptomyces antibioticus]|uniref:YoaK family protein n=1 Tax=Streptomyces antibioticus TaxID=1890 RepID=UPI0033E93079